MNNSKKPSHFDTNDGLFIPNRQLSMVIGSAIAVTFCVFMGGYFVGKNHMIEPLMVRVENSSFADQVYASLYARYEHDFSLAQKEEMTEEDTPSQMVAVEEITEMVPVAVVSNNQFSEIKKIVPDTLWYAPLIGYPNEQSAVAFANKLQKKGIGVHVKKYPSSTPKGKQKKYWYQVVTDSCADRDMLKAVVDKVAHEEKLKNVVIKKV